MLELYHSGLTTCSKQVRLCLREKGIPYVSRYIELWNYENLNPEYLKLNPNGVVPTLVHDGKAIFNSFVIMEYLEDFFPEPPMRPADPRDRARMRLWTWTADDTHLATTTMTYDHAMKDRVADLTPEEQQTMLQSTPVPERRARWTHMVKGGFPQADIDAAVEKADFCMGRMDEALASGPWLAGTDYSLADIAMLSIVHRIGEINPELIAPARRQRIADWRDRMMARPAVAWVYTPGTEETPPRPAHKSISGIR